MGAKSTIKTLPPEILAAVDRALGAHHTLDDIVAMLDDMGAPRSRSSVGRYAKDYAGAIRQMRHVTNFAKTMGEEIGDEKDDTQRILNHMVSSIGTRIALSYLENDRTPDVFEAKELSVLSKNTATSRKMDEDVRRAQRKENFAEAAKVAEVTARKAGASEETIELIKRELLGLE